MNFKIAAVKAAAQKRSGQFLMKLGTTPKYTPT